MKTSMKNGLGFLLSRTRILGVSCLSALCLLAAGASADELLANRSFDVPGGAGWGSISNSQFTVFLGEAYLHPIPGGTGTVLWQNLDIANAGGAEGSASVVLRKTSAPAGNTIAVYLEYTVVGGTTNRLLLFNPNNNDISVPTTFSTNLTLPSNAQRIVRLSVDKTTNGSFYAQEFSLDMVSSNGTFFPGSGGSIPVIASLTGITNQIGGLRVIQVQRWTDSFGGTDPLLDLAFPAPSTYGATGYRLQRSLDGVSGWENQPNGGGNFETPSDSTDNFSFTPDGSYYYRLLVLGGPKDGQLSNVVFAPLTGIETYFAGWNLDESMTISGIMTPWVGRGLEASFTVRKWSDRSIVEGALTYQWYRVNPLSFEMTPISGATNLIYITTTNDLGGYRLLCRATGDEISAGGFVQILDGHVLIPNNSFAENVSKTGFRLNLYKSVSSLTPADLELSYYDESFSLVKVPITSVTPLAGNASFDIVATMPDGVKSLGLKNISDVWAIGSEMMMGDFMEGLQINLPVGPYTYTTNSDGTITITGYTGPDGAVEIPSSIDGKTVSGIGGSVFWSCTNLVGVSVPAGVTNVADYAFEVETGGDALMAIYFQGNAPAVVGEYVLIGHDNAVVYRLPTATGWPTVPGLWGDHPTALWITGVSYVLTVNSGTGGGSYTNLQRVLIAAGPVSGKTFDRWTGATQFVASVTSSPTVVTMPPTNITVTATYKTAYYTLTVNGGTGDGSYTNGQRVTIKATIPAGWKFDRWNDDNTNATRIITMPAASAVYTASFKDILNPVLTVSSPVTGVRLTNALVTVVGKATDNSGAADVLIRLNSGSWMTNNVLLSTTNWTVGLTLQPGANVVQAYACDAAGNSSLTSSVVYTYLVYGTLSIQTNGVGTVKRAPATAVEIGQTYTLTATPGTGYGFVNWAGEVTGTNKVVTFKMTSNATVVANFADNVKPTVTITAPTAALRILGTNGLFTVRGTAADNKALTNVLVQLNGGSWTDATTTNVYKNWSLPVALIPGTNTIRAYSVDTTGNNSLTSSVVCTYVVGGNLTIQTNGPGTVTRMPIGAPEIGVTYTLTAVPAKTGSAFSSWTGDAAGTNKVLSFSMTSNMTIAANFVDIQNPTVAIAAPTPSLRISNEVYTVKGTAADNGVLTNVLCRINSGAWTNAATTNSWKNWSVPVVLKEGSNLVQACSVDSGGNVSSFAGVSCTYVVTALLTVQKTGAGTVSPDLNGQALEIGRNYTITATPGAGSVFTGWTCGVGGEEATNKPAITFMMQSNLVLTANFVGLPDLSEDGLSALSGFLDTNSISYGDALLIADAADAFDLAVQGSPNNYTNRIYNAVAIMLNLINDPAVRGQAAAYGLDMDNLFDPTLVFPTNAPTVDASVDNLAAAVLPAIDKAWTNLNVVPSTWAGRIEISTNRFPVDESVWVDTGDVTAMKAALKGLRAFVGLLKSYSLNVNYTRLIDPVATPHRTITVDGSIADWTNVPRSLVTFDYPDITGGKATVTQEVAVALDGTNVALLVTGCPFAISDTFLISFELCLSDGNALNASHTWSVDLWANSSVIYGMINRLKIDGLETALLDGTMEIKIPIQDGLTASQVTVEQVGCAMDFGGGMQDAFQAAPPGDTPISIFRANHPEFLSKVRNLTSLAGVKTDLTAALSGYLAADTLIGKRSGENAGLLHLVDFNPADPQATQSRLEMKANVAQILASLTSAVLLPADEDIEGAATRPVFLGAFFKAPYITTNILPSGLKGTLNNPSWNTFPDPTLNGILSGMTSTNLTKYLLGYTWGWVGTVRDLTLGAKSPYQLQFSVGTDISGKVITNVTVSGSGVPLTKFAPPSDGRTDWGTSCAVLSSIPAGTIYTFTVDFADGSREIVYHKINTWITVAPTPSFVGATLRWTNVSGSVPNADHYVVRGDVGWVELPLTQTSLDLSPYWDGTGPTPYVEVGIVNANWDEAYRSN